MTSHTRDVKFESNEKKKLIPVHHTKIIQNDLKIITDHFLRAAKWPSMTSSRFTHTYIVKYTRKTSGISLKESLSLCNKRIKLTYRCKKTNTKKTTTPAAAVRTCPLCNRTYPRRTDRRMDRWTLPLRGRNRQIFIFSLFHLMSSGKINKTLQNKQNLAQLSGDQLEWGKVGRSPPAGRKDGGKHPARRLSSKEVIDFRKIGSISRTSEPIRGELTG